MWVFIALLSHSINPKLSHKGSFRCTVKFSQMNLRVQPIDFCGFYGSKPLGSFKSNENLPIGNCRTLYVFILPLCDSESFPCFLVFSSSLLLVHFPLSLCTSSITNFHTPLTLSFPSCYIIIGVPDASIAGLGEIFDSYYQL